MLLLTLALTSRSLRHPQGHWFSRAEYDLLGPGLPDFNRLLFSISRIRFVLPKQIRLRGSVSGTGISATEVVVSHGVRLPVCGTVFQQWQCYR